MPHRAVPRPRRSARAMLIVSVTVATAVAACGKSSSPGAGAGSAAASGSAAGTDTAAPAAADAGRAEQAKLSAAIECLNRHSGRIFETRDTYLASVDPATGAARADRPPVLPGLYGLDPCRRLVKEAGAMTPAIADLDGASAAYVAALEGLDTAYGALAAYYKKGENLDDKGAKAATLHPAAMAAFDAFAVAHRGLDGVVREMNRKRRVDDLAAREKAVGRKLEVIIDSMMLEAETLIAMVTAADGVDPAAVAAQAEAYGKLVDETDAYAGAHADEAAERGSITNLKNYSKTFLAAAKVVSRKLTAKEAPTDDDRAAAVEQYNALVDNYNHH